MSKTNQVCICCEARDNCPHYDTRRTVCVPVKCTDWEDFSTIQDTTDWQHYRIQAAIAAMQAELSNPNNTFMMCEDKRAIIVRRSVAYADFLIAKLQKKEV